MKPLIYSFLFFLCATVISCSGDGDPDPTKDLPKLSINDAAGEEGMVALFTVTLSATSTETVSFKYKTVAGTATDPDFDPVGSPATLTIAPGQTTAQITIDLNSDTEDEESEKFTVVLSDPTNAALSDDITGNATINNVVAFFMTAKVDGAQWTAAMTGFFEAEFIDITFGSYGTGSFNDSQLSFIFFEVPSGPKNYEIDPHGANDNNHVGVYWTPNFFSSGMMGETFNGQDGGEFNLTRYDATNKIAEGTFAFTTMSDGGGTHVFTDGKFRVRIE